MNKGPVSMRMLAKTLKISVPINKLRLRAQALDIRSWFLCAICANLPLAPTFGWFLFLGF
jgi:hypothetical protein